MKRKAGLAFLWFCCVLHVASRALADFAAEADWYLKDLTEKNEFSGTVLIAKQGETVFSKGYGLANREHDVANSLETKFRLGSITKQFTAMCVMMLEREGKLTVQDPVCKYVEDCPESWKAITIRHLLTHTSGIPGF